MMNATQKALNEREEIKRRLVRINNRLNELLARNAPEYMVNRMKVDRAWCIQGMKILNLELADKVENRNGFQVCTADRNGQIENLGAAPHDEKERMKENGDHA